MHIIKIKDEELLLVEVPMEASGFNIHYGNGLQYMVDEVDSLKVVSFNLPHGYEQILGTLTNGVISFVVENYVEREPEFGWTYRDYELSGTQYDCLDAADSFLSLLQSQGIEYANKKLVIILKK